MLDSRTIMPTENTPLPAHNIPGRTNTARGTRFSHYTQSFYRAGALGLVSILLVTLPTLFSLGVVEFLSAVCQLAPLALIAAFVSGIVFGSITNTFGPHWLRRGAAWLTHHDKSDTTIASVSLAVFISIPIFIGIVQRASLVLVAKVARKDIGGLLLGVSVIAAVLLWPAVVCILYRGTRHLGKRVPKLGKCSRVLFLFIITTASVVAATLVAITQFLDWRALPIFGYLSLVTIFLGALGGSLLRIPHRVQTFAFFGCLTLILAAGSIFVWTPSKQRAENIVDTSAPVGMIVPLWRTFFDKDKDGVSAYFHGPDCDDSNPAVYPGAKEIPSNGIDEDCFAGDAEDLSTTKSADTRKPTAAPLTKRAQNAIVIVVDTMRADRLGINGYTRQGKSLTPRIDEIAKRSMFFRRAYAQSPRTPRSVPSLLTSRYPSYIQYNNPKSSYPAVSDQNQTVFESMQAQGMKTFHYSSHFYFDKKRNLTQGIDRYDNQGAKNIAGSNKDIASPRIVAKATTKLKQLAETKTSFGMFVHLFEPHSTYVRHPGNPVLHKKGTDSLQEKYDYEIAFVDSFVGQLWDTLQETGLASNTVVCIVSDHGEAFGEHRIDNKRVFFHGTTLYEEIIRVPLLIYSPQQAPDQQPRTIDTPVMLVDVAPTLLDLLGIAAPKTFQGISLLPHPSSEGEASKDRAIQTRAIFSELLPYPHWKRSSKTIVDGNGQYKLYYQITDNRFALYDLTADPKETKNLYKTHPDIAKALTKQLSQFIGGAPQ